MLPVSHDLVVDANGVPFVLRASPPPGFEPTIKRVTTAIERLADVAQRYKSSSGRYGKFGWVKTGISYGGGQKVCYKMFLLLFTEYVSDLQRPSWLKNNAAVEKAMTTFRNDPHVMSFIKHAMSEIHIRLICLLFSL